VAGIEATALTNEPTGSSALEHAHIDARPDSIVSGSLPTGRIGESPPTMERTP
jgi:hypothetical protein